MQGLLWLAVIKKYNGYNIWYWLTVITHQGYNLQIKPCVTLKGCLLEGHMCPHGIWTVGMADGLYVHMHIQICSQTTALPGVDIV